MHAELVLQLRPDQHVAVPCGVNETLSLCLGANNMENPTSQAKKKGLQKQLLPELSAQSSHLPLPMLPIASGESEHTYGPHCPSQSHLGTIPTPDHGPEALFWLIYDPSIPVWAMMLVCLCPCCVCWMDPGLVQGNLSRRWTLAQCCRFPPCCALTEEL